MDQVIRIDGINLGRTSYVYLFDAFFNETIELATTYLTNHTSLTFQAPNWQGANLTIYVDVSGQSSTPLLMLSYAPPNFTVSISGDVPTTGGTIFTITGTNLGRQFVTLSDGITVQVRASEPMMSCCCHCAPLPFGRGVPPVPASSMYCRPHT